ncbi:hypothetical protein KUM_1238 [Taylorella asinigenitalis 14/45]|uniref:Uncharacterized protein n=1 Tax=Taylorella asinigenitalis 14/45 TaxID=1091495 RepID=I7ILE7_9BURK|nr:hypothetical protein [Taylorella asinigenitalis]CCG20019.1 hypothetical protein KUM_1238 [Taylorella asinigenitalis 14/45]
MPNCTINVADNYSFDIENTEEREVLNTRTVTIDGFEDELFNNSRIQKITGNQNLDISIDEKILIGGNLSTDISSNNSEKIGIDQNITIFGSRDEKISGSVDEKLNSNYKYLNVGLVSYTISSGLNYKNNANHSDILLGSKNEIINGNSITSVGSNFLNKVYGGNISILSTLPNSMFSLGKTSFSSSSNLSFKGDISTIGLAATKMTLEGEKVKIQNMLHKNIYITKSEAGLQKKPTVNFNVGFYLALVRNSYKANLALGCFKLDVKMYELEKGNFSDSINSIKVLLKAIRIRK